MEDKIFDPQLIQIDEADIKAFKNIRKNLNSSYERLGLFVFRRDNIVEQFNDEEKEIKEQIKSAQDKVNNFLDMLADKYSFSPDVTWRFDEEKECFVEVNRKE